MGVVGVESERDGEAPRAFIVKREGIHLTEQVMYQHFYINVDLKNAVDLRCEIML